MQKTNKKTRIHASTRVISVCLWCF